MWKMLQTLQFAFVSVITCTETPRYLCEFARGGKKEKDGYYRIKWNFIDPLQEIALLIWRKTIQSSKWWFKCHLVAKRYKNFRRFVYNYEAETLNGVNGATDNKSGPKISCQVCFTAANVLANATCWIGSRHLDVFNVLCRLRLTYLRLVASSSVQQSAHWKRFMTWMERETQFIVPRPELRPSKRPWPSE